MFTAIFFLILNLLLFATAMDQTRWPLWPHQPWMAFGTGLALFAAFLCGLSLQNRLLMQRRSAAKEQILFASNLEILFYFIAYYFLLGAHRPIVDNLKPLGFTAGLLFALSLYFAALFVAHFACEKALKPAFKPVQFLLPFAAPLVFLILVGDLEALIPFSRLSQVFNLTETATFEVLAVLLIDLLALVLALVLMPPLAISIWGCRQLQNSALEERLNALCRKAHFRHSGFRIWNVLPQACTAAIVGIISRYRYILFTPRLLTLLSAGAIEAVVAHEMGHSKRRHLLIYPFILAGMGVFGSLGWHHIFVAAGWDVPEGTGPVSAALVQLAFFLGMIVSVILYLRIVFGYFSRAFERQADLHVIEIGVPLEAMVEALDTLAKASGNIHDVPNWHHHSIRERISFLERAHAHPHLIRRHHRRVQWSVIAYGLLFLLASAYLIVQISGIGYTGTY